MFVSRYGTYLKEQRYEKLFFVDLYVTIQYKALGTVQKRIRLKKVLRFVSVDDKCVFCHKLHSGCKVPFERFMTTFSAKISILERLRRFASIIHCALLSSF
jgi:hypothetical protein